MVRLSKHCQEIEAQLAHTQQALQAAYIDLEVEKEQYQRLSADWNALIEMLERVLRVKVYGDGAHWTAEYDGRRSTAHQTVASAFEQVLGERLAQHQ